MTSKTTAEEIRDSSGEIKQSISDLAYEKWEIAGKPHGRDSEFWLSAESEIIGEKLGS